jgi:hypothetical protein
VAAIDATLVLRFGLAVLFAANALVAWIDPDDFISLVEDSGVGRLIDSQVVLWGIRVNDFLAVLAVLFVWNRFPRLVPAWIGLYLAGVGVIKLAAMV